MPKNQPPPDPSAPSDKWQVQILGGLSVEGNGLVFDKFPTRRSALILIRLALAQGRSVSREAIGTALWPDEFPATIKPRLRQELTRLKRALGEAEGIVESDRLSLRLDTTLADIDLKTAENIVLRSSLAASILEKGKVLDQLAMYPAEIAPGYDEPWIVAAREDWRNRTSQHLLDAAEALVTGNDVEHAIRLARKAASNYLLSEAVQSRFLKILVRLDRHEEAALHVAELNRAYRQLLGAGPTSRLARWVSSHLNTAPKPSASRTDNAVPRKLPAALNKLFGRDAELKALTTLLDPSRPTRLVTVTGPGGIGKSQLAFEAGRQISAKFDQRVWFISLVQVDAPGRIGKVVLDALGLTSVDEDPFEAIAAALQDAPAVLILDNFEQLVDGGAQICRRLLEKCESLKLVVTTRRKLNIESEYELPVGPLPLSEAVDLFLTVARSAGRSIGLDETNLEIAKEIVQLLDRMPLAIHLAGSRASVLSLSEIGTQLGKRFDLLVSRRSDLEPRHRTLKQTISWSFDQLRPEAKRFFIDLSVFQGTWTASLAEEVLTEPDTLQLIEELRENSFVFGEQVSDQMRFGMLATIRQFAREQQDPKRQKELGRRLSVALLRFAEEAEQHMLSSGQLDWYGRLELEQDNIRGALEYASEFDPDSGVMLCRNLWRFWSVRGHQVEAKTWYDRLLVPDAPHTQALAGALFGAGRCASEQGDIDSAIRWYERARSTHLELGNEASVSKIEMNLGGAYLARRDYEEGARLIASSAQYFATANDTYMEALCRDDLALAYLEQGHLAEAAVELERARTLQENQEDQIAFAYCLGTIGRHRHLTSEFAESLRFLESSLQIHEVASNAHGIGLAHQYLADLALTMGQLDQADRHLAASSESRISVGDRLGLAHTHRLKGKLEKERGNLKAAESELREAARLFRLCGCGRWAELCVLVY